MSIKTKDVYYPLYKDKEKFIILITGGRGCESPDQKVMMADLTVKAIKDIKVGDKVMGDDGTPRKVLDVHSGYGKLYKVRQSNADDYVVNDGHILCLKKGDKEETGYNKEKGIYNKYPNYPKYLDMPIEEYINKPKNFRRVFRGYKCGSIPYLEQKVKLDPYMLGVWLGDGTATRFHITNPDKEIIEYIYEFAKKRGMIVNVFNKQGTDCKTYSICYKDYQSLGNPLVDILKDYGIFDNKHIPQEYITNSEQVRLELLAGLLDSDGHYDGYSYEITQKSEYLARQIKFVADTLGFRTSIRPKHSTCNGKDCGMYWRVDIEGDLCCIPCKVARKKAHLHTGRLHRTKSESSLKIREYGYGKWVGIYIDGNHHYLHSDGTIFHNSGKSFAASTFIERLTFEYNAKLKLAHKILYSRYTMVSAAISVIPEVYEKIDADGTDMYFKRTKTDIVNKMTGAQIMFRGIHTSSGNQTAKLKSIQGITTFVVDEAEEWTSEADFERIMLSIRQQGLQNRIIIIMNPADSSHWVYKRFIEKTHRIEYFDGVPVQISTHPNVLHIHTTYLDNIENLAPQFLNEVLTMKEQDPDRYAHVVIGRWADVAEGAVFKNVGICDHFPEGAKHIARAVDYGYSKDFTAIVRCGIMENRLYIDELCYKTGMTSKDIIDEFKREEDEGNDGFVYSESADPRLVDEIAVGGIVIYPVRKGPGSVLAGISKMQTYEIVVTKHSENLINEFRNYVWAKDKDGNYVNEPVDAFNHCFRGDTLVKTETGEIPIKDVKAGMKVFTSNGLHDVVKVFNNGIQKIIRARIDFIGGFHKIFYATPGHLFKTKRGWVKLKDLKKYDILYRCAVRERYYTLKPMMIKDFRVEQIDTCEVYNLEIDEVHDFFANGILVHNCIDAARYYVLGKIMGRIMDPKTLDKSKLGIY